MDVCLGLNLWEIIQPLIIKHDVSYDFFFFFCKCPLSSLWNFVSTPSLLRGFFFFFLNHVYEWVLVFVKWFFSVSTDMIISLKIRL